MTDDFVITPNPSQQARYRTRCGFPSELRTPGSAAIDLKRRYAAAADGWRDERIAADPHGCPTGLPFGVGVHETTFRVNVRWVTPLGEETASTS